MRRPKAGEVVPGILVGRAMANDPILPHPDVLNEVEYGRFILTNLAAKRAKQIKEGAPPLVRIASNHPLSVALAEIAAGKIRPLMGEEAEAAMAGQLDSLDVLGTDRFLLPALDDEEAFVDAIDVDGEEDEDANQEVPATSVSLLDNLLGDDDIEVDVEVSEDAEISLDDLAKEEEEEDEAGSVEV